MSLIKPHGSDVLNPLFISNLQQRNSLGELATTLPKLAISSAAAGNAVMLGSGYFNPLTGYMNKADVLAVARNMRTTDGLLWPVPVVNLVAAKSTFDTNAQVALIDPNMGGDSVIAIQEISNIERITDTEKVEICQSIFNTTDPKHPGVASFSRQGNYLVSGNIQVLNFSYFSADFAGIFATAYQIRQQLNNLNWQNVVAFQTRNPMHRAHEELCKMALNDLDADGVLIHTLLGKLKQGDIPAQVRVNAINAMVDNYFKPKTALVSGYGFDMLYAGPKEAVLHAIFRQNCGCNYLIVGRDHAGVGDYYGAFDAQTIFDDISRQDLAISIYRADHTAYSKKLEKVVMMKDATDHTAEDFVLLSGTKVREMLDNGIAPPPEFSRPEVAQILMDYYQSLA